MHVFTEVDAISSISGRASINYTKSSSGIQEGIFDSDYYGTTDLSEVKKKIINNPSILKPNTLYLESAYARALGYGKLFVCASVLFVNNKFKDYYVFKNLYSQQKRFKTKNKNMMLLRFFYNGSIDSTIKCLLSGEDLEKLMNDDVPTPFALHHLKFTQNTSNNKEAENPSKLISDKDLTSTKTENVILFIKELCCTMPLSLNSHYWIHSLKNKFFKGSCTLDKLKEYSILTNNPNIIPWGLRSEENWNEFNLWLAGFGLEQICTYEEIISLLN